MISTTRPEREQVSTSTFCWLSTGTRCRSPWAEVLHSARAGNPTIFRRSAGQRAEYGERRTRGPALCSWMCSKDGLRESSCTAWVAPDRHRGRSCRMGGGTTDASTRSGLKRLLFINPQDSQYSGCAPRRCTRSPPRAKCEWTQWRPRNPPVMLRALLQCTALPG